MKRLSLSAGALALAWLGAGVIVDTAHASRALPGVHLETTTLSGLDEGRAKELLDVRAASLLSSPVVFSYGGREWRPAAAEMGIKVDTARMAREAVAAGRNAPSLLRWPQAALAPALKPKVPFRATLDDSQLAAFLGAVALEVDRTPVSANLAVRNGQLVSGQPADGQRVDAAATAKLVRAPNALDDTQRVGVVVTTTAPPLTEAGVSEARALASKTLSGPLTLRAPAAQKTWTLTPAMLGTMLDFKRVPTRDGSEQLTAALNEARVAAYVKTLAADVDRPAVPAQLRWNGTGVQVVRESHEGLKLDQPAAVKAIVSQAAQDSREVSLPATVVKPAVVDDNVAQLGINELVATGTSKFAGSGPERVNNIQVAAARLNGTVIPAGTTFSFLDALGPITKENGYQEGLTILGDETVPGIGGGVCQVSTTVFRAAFYAGLPIVERHQHSYRVGYYEQDGSPVGFDAAVYDPGVDLRFKNDTGAAILIQSAVDPATSTLTFRLYGTNTRREVKLAASKANEVKAGPRLPDVNDPTLPKGVRKQVEWKADGVDATIRRSVLQGGQTLFGDAFFSRYAAWQEKWVVGTGPAA